MKTFSSVIFLCFLLSASAFSSGAADIITPNQPIPDGQTIISNQGNFKLGFFSLDNESPNRYLGIWYSQIPAFTVVWVANRDAPLNDTSGLLKLTQSGILQILTNRTNSVIWSSRLLNSTANSNPNDPVAQLLDSGNFVVRNGNDDSPENYFWESFDYPGNTALPGVKFGLNLKKGIDRYLQSWKSSNDPSRGDYIFRMDSSGFPQEFMMNGSVITFRSGPWNGLRFSGSPGLKPNQIYTYEFVNTPEEIYYKFDLINRNVYTQLVLNPDGVLHRFTWNNRTGTWQVYLSAPADRCDAYGLCHDYGICSMYTSPVCNCLDRFVPQSQGDWQSADWTGGCVRRTPLDCKKGDGFRRYSGIKLPDTQHSWYNQSITLKECQKMCLRNCSCMAYSNTDVRGKGSGCLLWFEDLLDIVKLNENGQDIYIRLASSEIGTSPDKVKIIRITLGLLGGFLLVGLILTLYIWKRKEKKSRQKSQLKNEGQVASSSEQLHTNEREREDLELPLIDLGTIVKATNNFSQRNKLGEGGFGPVYKGVLMDGQEIAVKRLSEYSIQGPDEFKNEVKCIAQLQHRNLVKLLGCCIQAEEKMLIYEFMPNKSLDLFIFDDNRNELLDWPKRYEILNGIARGLLYLHRDSRLRIIHRDLKAGNILLDSDMKPKISDFGMARIFGGAETEANTKRIVGTYGYMPPEYAVDGYFSTKSDVFSYGVLVLEIVSGRKNRGFCHPDHHHNLLGHAWLFHKEGRFQELIDPHLIQSCYLCEVIRSIHIALLCVQQSPEDRPSMSSVVFMLANEGALPTPKEPGFFTERNLFFEPEKSSSTKPADSSSIDFSITLLDPR